MISFSLLTFKKICLNGVCSESNHIELILCPERLNSFITTLKALWKLIMTKISTIQRMEYYHYHYYNDCIKYSFKLVIGKIQS